MAKEVMVTAQKIKRKKQMLKILRIGTLVTIIVLFLMFAVLSFVFNGGKFSISLDKDLTERKSIVLYENSIDQDATRKLYAEDVEYMDNISINWIPADVDGAAEGSHNGENYIAYTFYLENQGEETTNYWYTIFIDDVIKDVDEAIRVMVYKNGERTVYAKANMEGEAEKGTEMFYSDEIAVLEQVTDFEAGDVDKFTIVVFIEGDDPDCVNKIIGGEIQLHMEITAEKVWVTE